MPTRWLTGSVALAVAVLWAASAIWMFRTGAAVGAARVQARLDHLTVQLADAKAKASESARAAEHRQAAAAAAIAESYQRGQADAQVSADRIIADLRAGNLRLREQWRQAAAAGDVPTAAGAGAGDDAAERSRERSAGRIVRATDRCVAQVSALQAWIRSALATINGDGAGDARPVE